jgi:alpha-L-fucosidase 2
LANGKISGLKGRGGFEIDITWENGELLAVKVKSVLGNPLNLRYNTKTISKETTAGETYLFGLKDFH